MALTLTPARWLIPAGLLLLLWPTLATAATPEDARRAYDAGRFTDAMGIWNQLTRQGNAEAEFGLGLLYDLGNGTPEDPGSAFAWYMLAADAGVPAAEFNVAAMYAAGRGVAQSSEKAALWYARAGARGHHRAQFSLGLLYQQGDGVPRNPAAAAVWFKLAAEGGLSAANDRLKALQAADPRGPRAPAPAKPVAAAPVWPAKDANLTVVNNPPTTELVWTAPPGNEPVHYELQMLELGGADTPPVQTASMTTTATVVTLPAKDAECAWKIDTVANNGARATGEWQWFSVGSGPRTAQSMASPKDVSRAH